MHASELRSPLHVVIAGGGVAALEAALALRDLAGDRVALTLLTPGKNFVVRPMLVSQPFGKGGPVTKVPFERIARDVGAILVEEGLDRVDAAAKEVVTSGGARLSYDAAIVAVGARPVASYERALTFTMDADPQALNGLLRDLEEGYSKRVAFVVPPGNVWSLPIYELALMTARQVWGMGIDDLELHLVTPEQEPLEAFGLAAVADVKRLLAAARIELHAGSEAEQLADGTLRLLPSGDHWNRARVVALPVLDGPRIDGLPMDANGFIPVDDHGRVADLQDVYAAGDATSSTIKQGGLAAQQADVVAQVIARDAGVDLVPEPYRPVLRGTLLTGGDDHHLRSTEHGVGLASDQLLWWPPGKVAGRLLAPYLAGELGQELVDMPPHASRTDVDVAVLP